MMPFLLVTKYFHKDIDTMDISLLNDAQANHTTQEFTKLYNEVFRDFFSRDENLWQVYKDPGFAALNHFRSKHLQPSERLGAFSNSSELHEALLNQNHVPANRMKPTGKPDDVLAFAAALSKDWENPSSVENVITMPSDPAIYGAMMGTLANPNLVYSEYAGMAEQLEKMWFARLPTQSVTIKTNQQGCSPKAAHSATYMAICLVFENHYLRLFIKGQIPLATTAF